jgi:hypothetical protein
VFGGPNYRGISWGNVRSGRFTTVFNALIFILLHLTSLLYGEFDTRHNLKGRHGNDT